MCVQNLNHQAIRMWIGRVCLQYRSCHKSGNKKQGRSLAAGYVTLKSCVTDFSRRKYNPQILILKQKTSFEQLLNWVIQRTALGFWHFPDWERVCQGIKKSHHSFPAIYIFSLNHHKTLSVPTSLVSSHVHSQPEQILLQYLGSRCIFPNYTGKSRALDPQQVPLSPLVLDSRKMQGFGSMLGNPVEVEANPGLSQTSGQGKGLKAKQMGTSQGWKK